MSNIEISKDPAEYEDPRLAALVEDIEGIGLEQSIIPIKLAKGQKIRIEGEDNFFEATGPIVLFVAALPMEALADDEDQEERPEDDPQEA